MSGGESHVTEQEVSPQLWHGGDRLQLESQSEIERVYSRERWFCLPRKLLLKLQLNTVVIR